jgi:hypothetical protein
VVANGNIVGSLFTGYYRLPSLGSGVFNPAKLFWEEVREPEVYFSQARNGHFATIEAALIDPPLDFDVSLGL